MNWEIGIDINILPCAKQIASGNLPCSTESLAQRSVTTERGGVGDGGREGLYV